jgi:DNA-binding NarL/FixJ family response regulator
MRLLIIEDNTNKMNHIKELVNELYPDSEIMEAHSFNSGVKKVYEDGWDIVLLDMSLPTYDISHTEGGGDKKPIAGKNIMKRIMHKKMSTPVIVITQFETFDDDKISLESLNKEFENDFKSIWRGTIFYGNEDWAINLKNLLYEILDKE